MKKLNRITACFLTMSISLSSVAVYATDVENYISESYIEETTVDLMGVQSDSWDTSSSRGSVTVSDDDKDIVLNTNTSSRYNAIAEATTAMALDTPDNDISLKFNLQTEGFNFDGQRGTVSINREIENGVLSADLISISNTTLTVLGDSDSTLEFPNGLSVTVDILFNIENGNIIVEIGDNEYIFTDNAMLKTLYSDIEENNILNVSFKNASTRINTNANLMVTDFEMSQNEKFIYEGISVAGKEIGASCDIDTLAEGIKISFSGVGSADIYNASNYSFKVNGVIAEFTISEIEDGVLLTINTPFTGGDAIEFVLNSVKDNYGIVYIENLTKSFVVLDDNYVYPSVELNCDEAELHVGETALIDVVLEGSSWDYAEVYINDIYKENVERKEFQYRFMPDEEGTYLLRFDVIDNTYEMKDSKEITVNFHANKTPEIIIDKYADGDTISVFEGNEGHLQMSVSDDLGVEKTEIYVNNFLVNTFTETDLIFDLSILSLGTSNVLIKTYDIYGRTKEVEVSVSKSKEVSTEILSEKDFVEEKNTYKSGISIARQRGYIRTDVVDDAFGTSMIIGKDEAMDTEKYTGDQYTFFQHSRNNSYPLQRYEFDLNILKAPTKDARCLNFAFRYTDGTIPILFSVKKSKFDLGFGTASYVENKWYHVSIIITKTHYNITVTDEEGNKTTGGNVPIDTSKVIGLYRFYVGDVNDTSNLFDIAIDNITVSSVAHSLLITGIGSVDEEYSSSVPAGAESFCLYIDGTVVADDINKDNITLYCGREKVGIEKIRYSEIDKLIEIYPCVPLSPDSKYTVEFSGNIRFHDKQILGEDLVKTFETGSESIAINLTDWQIVRDNLKLKVNASNLDDVDRKIYIFMSEFDDYGSYIKTTVYEKLLSAGSGSHDIECTLENGASSNVNMFVSDGTNIGRIYYAEVYEQDYE